jgi:ribosomal protein S18 acetylase RimI-like enzyme
VPEPATSADSTAVDETALDKTALDLRPTPFDHPDAVRLIAELQAIYVGLYGDGDDTPVDPAEFAAPAGYFVLGYLDGVAVASGGWRAREGGDDPQLRPGDAEIKRMYVVPAVRGRGFARAVLAELERSAAAAGRRRMVLETATLQPEAIGLYVAGGYRPTPNFGHYRDDPHSRCYAKPLVRTAVSHPTR